MPGTMTGMSSLPRPSGGGGGRRKKKEGRGGRPFPSATIVLELNGFSWRRGKRGGGKKKKKFPSSIARITRAEDPRGGKKGRRSASRVPRRVREGGKKKGRKTFPKSSLLPSFSPWIAPQAEGGEKKKKKRETRCRSTPFPASCPSSPRIRQGEEPLPSGAVPMSCGKREREKEKGISSASIAFLQFSCLSARGREKKEGQNYNLVELECLVRKVGGRKKEGRFSRGPSPLLPSREWPAAPGKRRKERLFSRNATREGGIFPLIIFHLLPEGKGKRALSSLFFDHLPEEKKGEKKRGGRKTVYPTYSHFCKYNSGGLRGKEKDFAVAWRRVSFARFSQEKRKTLRISEKEGEKGGGESLPYLPLTPR